MNVWFDRARIIATPEICTAAIRSGVALAERMRERMTDIVVWKVTRFAPHKGLTSKWRSQNVVEG